MKTPALKLILGIAVLAAASVTAHAQVAASTAAAKPMRGYDKWEFGVKNPVSWLTWGTDLRLRNEYLDNAITLNNDIDRHEQDYFRFRERIWAGVTPVTNLTVNARLATEQRVWMQPSYGSQFGFRSGLEERYLILDNANLRVNNLLGQPLSITAGRQDIQLGDPLNWWLVADGTPGDGSWTFFLDSIRLNYDVKDINTRIDLIYIYQNALPDEWIPTIGRSGENRNPSSLAPGNRPYGLVEQDEQGAILYLSNKSIKNTQVDGYFIYKHDSRINQFPNGDNADIYTVGAKITGTPADHWKYSVEGAYQFGTKQDPTVNTNFAAAMASRDISAFGVNTKVSYLFKDKLNNQAHLIYEFLSGDDPSTGGKDEMFNVLWGRWPRWSELYIYSYINENGGKIAQMNNLHRIGIAWNFDPIKNMNFSLAYNALFANQEVPTRASTAQQAQFSSDGIFRGHYVQAVLRHKFNDHVSAHLWGECVFMGDYYTHRDLMAFLRAEVLLTF